MCPITPQKPKKNCLTCFEKLQFNDQITVKDVNDVLEKNPIPDGCKGADHWLHHLICKSSVGSIQGFVDLLSNPPPFNWQQHAAEKKAKKQQRGTGFRSSSQLQWRLRQPHLPCSQLRRQQQQQQQLHLCWRWSCWKAGMVHASHAGAMGAQPCHWHSSKTSSRSMPCRCASLLS